MDKSLLFSNVSFQQVYEFKGMNTFQKKVFITHMREKCGIIIKKDWQCKAGRGRLTPYQSEDPNPTLPTYRGKEEKVKIVEDKKGESN